MGLGTGFAVPDVASRATLPMLFDLAPIVSFCDDDSESDALSQGSSSAHSTDAYDENREGALMPMCGRVCGIRGISIITSNTRAGKDAWRQRRVI